MGCPEGHNICDACHSRWGGVCSLCRQEVSVRNRQMEGFREGLTVVCSCEQTLSTKDLPSHRATCEMQPIRCPLAIGANAACLNLTRTDFEDHILRHHPDAPFLRLCLGPMQGDTPSFNASAPDWTMGMKVKVVPSADGPPTIVCFSHPDKGTHSVVMVHQSRDVQDQEIVVLKLKSLLTAYKRVLTFRGADSRL